MAGQLIARGEGTWLVRVYRGRADNGTRRYLNRTVHGTKKQAQRLLTKLLREHDTGELVEPTRETVGKYLDRWLRDAAKPRVQPRTLHDYRGLVRRYIRPALGDLRLHQLTPMQIQALYAEMQERGLSPRTVRYAHAVLRSALGQAVKWRLLPNNPATAVELPKRERREMKALDPKQAGRFLEAAKEDRFAALWSLLVTTGLRPGEAFALRWKDLDGDRVRVSRALVKRAGLETTFAAPKTDRSRRSVTLPASTVAALRTHRAKQAEEKLAATEYTDLDLIFATQTGGPLSLPNLTRRHFKPLLEAAGLPPMRLYDLRHTAATLLLAAGEHPKIVSERLGHATITLTLDTYSHVLPDMQAASAEKLEGLLFGTDA